MSHVTVESSLLSRLMSAQRMTEVRDPNGNVVGHFVPLRRPLDVNVVRRLFDLDKARETLKEQYHQGQSLKEILAELEAGESQG